MNTKKVTAFFIDALKITLIIVFAIVAYSIYNFYFHQGSHTPQPQPLSTRGLPVPATDVPVTLPPDPGEAGKATLAGIDSNNNGVRDDLEREIVYMYPQNQEVRRVLRAMVKKGQDMITTTGDHEHFKELMVSYSGFWDCYDYLVFGKNQANDTNFQILNKMIQN